MYDAGLSILHFVFAFLLAGALSAETFMLRLPMSAEVARRLLRIDLYYGIAAVGVIVAGVARVLWGAKDWQYYSMQPFFWAKIVAFALIGLMSIAPTMAYMRWTRGYARDAAYRPPEAEVTLARRLAMAEIHALVLLIVFAALMARGIGA